MYNFNNETYRAMVNDLLNDVFYVEGRSNRGKIATIRQYAEVIVRRILDCTQQDYVTLGNRNIVNKLKDTSENNPLLMSSVEKIKGFGNDCTHTQAVEEFSDEDVDQEIHSLFNLYSYLFIVYFEKYKFGSKSAVMSSFSILPPIIRFTALNFLYEKNRENLDLIDKLVLAILKAFDKSEAIKWIELRKSELASMLAVSEEGKQALIEKYGSNVDKEICSKAPNMYDLCFERVSKVSEIIECNGLLYDDFESAMPLFEEKGNIEGDAPEVNEFNNLMQFVYLGRKPENNNKLEHIDQYFTLDGMGR